MTDEEYCKEVHDDIRALCTSAGWLSDPQGRVLGWLVAGLLTDIHRIAGALNAPRDVPNTPVALIPAGVYYDANSSKFYSAHRNAGCGQRFYDLWKSCAAEFPQTREAALALPPWLPMKDAPRNATEIILRIPQAGYPDFYEQIGHWAEMDGSEQPAAKGWFRNTGSGFVELPAPTGWRWLSMTAPNKSG